MAAHLLGWFGGVCLTLFFCVGMWMAMPVMWNPFRAPTEDERAAFALRRERVPVGLWFGIGLVGIAAAIVAATL